MTIIASAEGVSRFHDPGLPSPPATFPCAHPCLISLVANGPARLCHQLLRLCLPETVAFRQATYKDSPVYLSVEMLLSFCSFPLFSFFLPFPGVKSQCSRGRTISSPTPPRKPLACAVRRRITPSGSGNLGVLTSGAQELLGIGTLADILEGGLLRRGEM